MKDLFLKILRTKDSYDYIITDPKDENFNHPYKKYTKNNAIDAMYIVNESDKKKILWAFPRVQTVANHPDFSFKDTIAPGKFEVELFVDPRKFHGEIHGIINAKDMEGQKINEYSMQIDNGYQKGRWLIHDRYSFEKERELRSAYSGGCFILFEHELIKLNAILRSFGYKKGDILKGILKEGESKDV